MEKTLVALVGRPNVGKSSLFNRLSGQRTAIVEDTPGVTRDRIYASCKWLQKTFSLVDTGGIEGGDDFFAERVMEQSELAVREAQVLVLVLDAREGLLPLDEAVFQRLQKSGKPLIVAVNKVDNPDRPGQLSEFYRLGKGLFPVSAEHGLGTGDLLDEIVKYVRDAPAAEEEKRLRIAIIGRPNVGKSSLLNAVLKEERNLVSERPGTTRDALDTPCVVGGKAALLIDTAGIRKRGRVKAVLEKYSVIKALQSIERANICLLVIDGTEGVTEQDTKLAGYIRNSGKACVVLLNKWDLLAESCSTGRETASFLARAKEALSFMRYAPMVLTSAVTGKGLDKALDLCVKVWEQANRRVPTPLLNQVFQRCLKKHAPPAKRGRESKLFYVAQSGVCPPTFTMFVNHPEAFNFSYLRYLDNRLREAFDFRGTPLRVIPRKRR